MKCAQREARSWFGFGRSFGALCGTLLVLSILVDVSSAEARIPSVLRSSTEPAFFQFEMGPAVSLHHAATQFKMTLAGGYHLFDTGDGPALGASMQLGFGRGLFGLQIGPRFWWDIPIVPGLGLYITPVAQLGYAVFTNGGSVHFLNMQFGLEPRLIIQNKGLVFFRFFTIDLLFGEDVAARYDMMVGGGITF